MAKWRNMCLSCSNNGYPSTSIVLNTIVNLQNALMMINVHYYKLWSYSWYTCVELQLTRGVSERKQTTHFGKYTNRTKHIAMMADNVGCTSSAPSILEWFELRLVYHALYTCLLFERLRLFAELLRFIPRFLRIYFGLPNKNMTAFQKKSQPLKYQYKILCIQKITKVNQKSLWPFRFQSSSTTHLTCSNGSVACRCCSQRCFDCSSSSETHLSCNMGSHASR